MGGLHKQSIFQRQFESNKFLSKKYVRFFTDNNVRKELPVQIVRKYLRTFNVHLFFGHECLISVEFSALKNICLSHSPLTSGGRLVPANRLESIRLPGH